MKYTEWRVDMLCLRVQKKNHQKRYYLGSDYRDMYLTSREIDVLKASVSCNTYKDIAGYLGLSERTIEAYFKPIKAKLSCNHKSKVIKFLLDSHFMDQLKNIELSQ